MDRVVIYGLGYYGNLIVEKMSELENVLDAKIVALVDKVQKDYSYKYPFFLPDSLSELRYDYILVTSENYYDVIRQELITMHHVRPEKVKLWKEWIVGRGDERFYCNICTHKSSVMLRHGHASRAFLAQKIVGGGIRNNAECPFCGSFDRNRWVQAVLEKETEIYKKKLSILHFAPEKCIEYRIRQIGHERYVTADIEKGRADCVIDITDIDFPDGMFDYIICNHVLEHIKEESKAFSELKRCLKGDGKIVFSVPFSLQQPTLEDDGDVDTPEKRLIEYGQEDHVRLYGNDLQERLENNGFKVNKMRVDEELPKSEIERLSLIPEDTVWLLQK